MMAVDFLKCIGIYLFWREFIVWSEISHSFRIFPYLSKNGRYNAMKSDYLVHHSCQKWLFRFSLISQPCLYKSLYREAS